MRDGGITPADPHSPISPIGKGATDANPCPETSTPCCPGPLQYASVHPSAPGGWWVGVNEQAGIIVAHAHRDQRDRRRADCDDADVVIFGSRVRWLVPPPTTRLTLTRPTFLRFVITELSKLSSLITFVG